MAKRKKRKDTIETLFQAVLLLSVSIGFYLTQNWMTSFIIAAVSCSIFFIIVLVRKRQKNERIRSSGISEIDSMDGVQFEEYLKLLFASKGYQVKGTTVTGDFGADLLLKKEGIKTVVQAKRYSKPVGIKAVQEVIPAMKMYDASEAWVVSNSSYTKAAIELAKSHNVRLIGRADLITIITGLASTEKPDPVALKKVVPQEIRKKCERCGSPLKIRNGKSGIFYGCSSFPRCKFTTKAT